jgi:hypothetical protein
MIEFRSAELPDDSAENMRWNTIAKNLAEQFGFTNGNKVCPNHEHQYYHNILTLHPELDREFYTINMEYTDVCCDEFKNKWVFRETLR